MKNIHVLPTDKSSRFFIDNKGKFHFREFFVPDTIQICKNYNIYITSDEELKEDDWFYDTIYESVFQWKSNKPKGGFQSKIILTTDQDLIADGVQASDDEFLEWFIKNPSCETVEVKEVRQRCHLSLRDWVDEDENGDFPMSIAGAFAYRRIYKTIITQEEPKQSVQEYEQQGMEKYSHELETETRAMKGEKMYTEEQLAIAMLDFGLYIAENRGKPIDTDNKIKEIIEQFKQQEQ
jgi:hypothetical protein